MVAIEINTVLYLSFLFNEYIYKIFLGANFYFEILSTDQVEYFNINFSLKIKRAV